ncbi:pyridoxal 5'-phosphate synthase glutaminase subunit PdxT [Candidatus Fermentibacteria bacterium]|nr:MAG: pyridoxal 5'-phosphate synthase glutaminase subunit PdxT [Candidatus Fermentibacteria bacterium]
MKPVIGVLALQGGVIEHVQMLRTLECSTREIRLPEHLKGLQALVIPGGESTALIKLVRRWNLAEPINNTVSAGLPVWGTCAGSILLSSRVTEREHKVNQESLALAPVTAERNRFGRQIASFQADLKITGIEETYPGVFIRAPLLIPDSDEIQVLSSVKEGPVFLRYRNVWLSSFHPELTDDSRVHALFLRESGIGS